VATQSALEPAIRLPSVHTALRNGFFIFFMYLSNLACKINQFLSKHQKFEAVNNKKAEILYFRLLIE
jgi:hypothetical protein